MGRAGVGMWLGAMALGLAALAWAGDAPTAAPPSREDRVEHTEAEWRARLTEMQFKVLREKGTERAFTGEYHDHHAKGVYVCAGCGLPLYASADKFDSGTGWPSYTKPVAEHTVDRVPDRALGMLRTELTCARCGGHLGHVFNDGPAPTGERHCINSASLVFKPAASSPAEPAPRR